jgi:hypothetical protein
VIFTHSYDHTVNGIKAPLLGSARLRHPVTFVTHGPIDLHDWMDSLVQVISGGLMARLGGW